MFIDSHHGEQFTENYIKSGVFDKCKKNAFIHIHDFVFWLEEWPEQYREPMVVTDYIMKNESKFDHYTFGQLFFLLGGKNTHSNLMKARDQKPGKGESFSDKNYFVRNKLPEQFPLVQQAFPMDAFRFLSF